ncbi:MAG: ABC transporter substrate binding protein [Ignavibacteria bacterium]
MAPRAARAAAGLRRPATWRIGLVLAAFLVAAAAAALQPGRGIAVIYPDIGEPYRSVFTKMIEGIEEAAHTRVPAFPVGAAATAQDIAGELRRQDVRVVIALGRNGLKVASGLDRDIGVVAGGVLSVPEAEAAGNVSVFSLAPDPALLFSRLHGFTPAVRRVFVIYDPRHNGWLMRLARDAAAVRGIELVAREAQDIRSALLAYQEILAAADPRRDALWLPQDPTTVDETAVLPLVLQEAWTRGLVLFSSNPVHVRRGALFSLYPNNVEIGRTLGASALGYSGSAPAARGPTPLKSVLLAVNVRTAAHLGINLADKRQSFDMVFPEP